MSTLEIILPLRNPTEVLEQTVGSLIAQTDRRFSVLISDNYSTQRHELITAAAGQLESAGIVVKTVRPPFELGRVEHWNWAHHESKGDWLKPVFMGDWLEPNYVSQLRAEMENNPECRYIFSSYMLHMGDQPPVKVVSAWAGKFNTAAELHRVVLANGMQFGPPSAAAYEREAFVTVGGYPTPLPICSDSLLFCTMAARFGALGLAEPLCHFNIHGARFSTSLPGRRKDSFRETLTYYFILAYHAWAVRLPFSKVAFARLLWRETRNFRAAK